MKKKIISLIVLCLILASCGKQTAQEPQKESSDFKIDISETVETSKTEESAELQSDKSESIEKENADKISDATNENSRCLVKLKVICKPNLMFDQYDLNLYIDNTYKSHLKHGDTGFYAIELEKGTHTLRIENEEEDDGFSIDVAIGSVNFDVSGDVKVGYTVNCEAKEIVINKQGVGEDEFKTAELKGFEKYYPTDKTINEKGYIYNVNRTFQFEKSQITIHKVLVRFVDNAYYGLFIDYTVKNNSDEPVDWIMRKHGNVYGEITTETMTDERLGGNSYYTDVEFPAETIADRGELEAGEESHHNILLLFNNWDEHYKTIELRENEHMKINLYYTENGTENKYTIDLNEPN